MAHEAAVELVEVTKVYGGRHVLQRLSLAVPRGQSLVIMGPSGCGKTVLLKHLIGLVTPDSGRLRVGGEDFWAASPLEQRRLRRRFGFVFQEGALFDSLDVLDNVAFPLRRHTRLTPSEVEARAKECLALVRLSGTERRHPSELSTGMRRRVGLARALALAPDILLFDEPTAGLDPMLVSVIDTLLRELVSRLQVTAVTVTHDLRTARAVGDRVALLYGGSLLADAPVEDFFQLPHPAVRQLVEGRAEGPLLPREELGLSGAPP